MRDTKTRECDVLVVGSGIAGTTAALNAARAGARTALASLGPSFSGSSFYPGTWGLGLVGPESTADEADFIATILAVGSGMANPALVEAFVGGIRPAIEELEGRGVHLRQPTQAGERAYIPCFDHKHRLWRGIERASYQEATAAALAQLNVVDLPKRELVDLAQEDGHIAGAWLYDRAAARLEFIRCSSVVLATGGFGGLFERRLAPADIVGSTHALALKHGCTLVNLEFMQIMPGLVSPRTGIVFNEKAFRFARLFDADGRDAVHKVPNATALLNERAGHGPFTSRLASRAIDLAIDAAGPPGLTVQVRPNPGEEFPEFVRTFNEWLENKAGISAADELRIAHYAHAANGGILIEPDGSTGVAGLFACGEVTGGMHGADRIGGLSSANGLVFGARAGRSAAAWATRHPLCNGPQATAIPTALTCALDDTAARAKKLRRTLSTTCMTVRDGAKLTAARTELDTLKERAAHALHPASDTAAAVATLRFEAQLTLGRALVSAALARTESRGAHYRADFPTEDPHQARPLALTQEQDDFTLEPHPWASSPHVLQHDKRP